jgi:hypothetical protein
MDGGRSPRASRVGSAQLCCGGFRRRRDRHSQWHRDHTVKAGTTGRMRRRSEYRFEACKRRRQQTAPDPPILAPKGPALRRSRAVGGRAQPPGRDERVRGLTLHRGFKSRPCPPLRRDRAAVAHLLPGSENRLTRFGSTEATPLA